MPVLLGETEKHKEYVYGVHTSLGIIGATEPYPIRSVRDDQFKLIWNLNHEATFENIITEEDRDGLWASWLEEAENDEHAEEMVERYQHRPKIELYDVREDPHELNNLAEASQYEPIIERLEAELRAWMEQQQDEGIQTELNGLERQ